MSFASALIMILIIIIVMLLCAVTALGAVYL